MPIPLIPLFAGKALVAGGIALYGHKIARRLQSPSHYAAQTPVLDPMSMLQGAWRIDGIAHGLKGRVAARVSGSLNAAWDAGTGRIDLALHDDHGERWHHPVTVHLDQQGEGTPDVAFDTHGVEGTGVLSGNSLRLRYATTLPASMGAWKVDAEDWIFVMPDGGFAYQGQYHKLGFPVGTFSGMLTRAR